VVSTPRDWALELSLASALEQTVGELEVLVVEDGDDHASRGVVERARDRRARALRLEPAAGTQSGPNALGWHRARAPVVAYLGHDDVWHPEHLARLLEALRPDVDVAHAVTRFLGAGTDTRIEVAGSRPWTPDAFVPPSSVAHWRDSTRLGRWEPADANGHPVDDAFLLAADARGARCATSGAATVFKHPAAWRLDSCRTRDASPQQAIRARLAAEPGLGERLVAEARAAGAVGILPAPQAAAPGVVAGHSRRLQGSRLLLDRFDKDDAWELGQALVAHAREHAPAVTPVVVLRRGAAARFNASSFLVARRAAAKDADPLGDGLAQADDHEMVVTVLRAWPAARSG
jgi:Glycosyl transferase family 2